MAETREHGNANNSGRATLRDVMSAVQGVHDRIDGIGRSVEGAWGAIGATNGRIDAVLAGQQALSSQIAGLHGEVGTLREATNERLHEMDSDIDDAKRPFAFFRSSWRMILVAAGASSAVTAAALHVHDLLHVIGK